MVDVESEDQSMQKSKSGKILFIVGIVFTLTVPTVLVIFGSVPAATVTLASGVFVTFMARIEGLSKFKVGFMEAEMKQVIEEANATLDQLKGVAKSVGKSALLDSMAANFMVGTAIENRLAIHDQIVESLTGLKLSNQEMSEVTDMWNRGIGVLFFMAVYNRLTGGHSNSAKHNKLTADVAGKYNKLLNAPKWKAPTPETMNEFLLANAPNLITDEVKALLEDYRNFIATGKLRTDVFRCLDVPSSTETFE